jgi:hypothetical protein
MNCDAYLGDCRVAAAVRYDAGRYSVFCFFSFLEVLMQQLLTLIA